MKLSGKGKKQMKWNEVRRFHSFQIQKIKAFLHKLKNHLGPYHHNYLRRKDFKDLLVFDGNELEIRIYIITL